jgi:2-C-methyl-D-erythritol 4-phosphate cytidylyltransferase/2-C-methyl-D-erythritol 2,4-cyclodiphosphate synthase
MSTAFVILAAGKGARLGGQPKQFRLLGGKTVFSYSLKTAQQLERENLISQIIIAVPPDDKTLHKLSVPKDVAVVKGGASRSLSVLNALKACRTDFVLLHDAARPFADVSLCRRVLAASDGISGVIPVLPEINALKRISDGHMTAVEREGIYITQTPQLFPRRPLEKMLAESSGADYKDEAEVWLKNGGKVNSVAGSELNFKITSGGDWQLAQKIAEYSTEIRNGLGYDVHSLMPGRRLILGGVEIPSPLGLDGHSDADVLCHACSDAVLSAAGLPDIGSLYPASEERYRGADSTVMFRDILSLVMAEGWHVDWISAVLTVQTPRLAPWKDKIIDSMNKLLDGKKFSVTFKSGERIGPAGDSEAVFVWASATISRRELPDR